MILLLLFWKIKPVITLTESDSTSKTKEQYVTMTSVEEVSSML